MSKWSRKISIMKVKLNFSDFSTFDIFLWGSCRTIFGILLKMWEDLPGVDVLKRRVRIGRREVFEFK
jgi:hypothetical protein